MIPRQVIVFVFLVWLVTAALVCFVHLLESPFGRSNFIWIVLAFVALSILAERVMPPPQPQPNPPDAQLRPLADLIADAKLRNSVLPVAMIAGFAILLIWIRL